MMQRRFLTKLEIAVRPLPVLWATLFLVQVLYVLLPPANPSLWFLAVLIWVTATPEGASCAVRSRS